MNEVTVYCMVLEEEEEEEMKKECKLCVLDE